ncbi:VOC family protein, partial [Streptomyces goshikiensis]
PAGRGGGGGGGAPRGGGGGAPPRAPPPPDPPPPSRVGDQTGGRVGFFLYTDDFAGDHARMTVEGVRFLEEPRHEPYGSVAVFEDLYGNRWDLLQPKAA